jgi:lipopolysaccharide transport system permease protein
MSSTPEHWDLQIKPQSSLFDLKLKEVWNYRDLMWLFVRRDFVAQYKQTILGPVWHIIQPILTTIMFLLIFGRIANIPTDGIQPILFYLANITVWNYFSTCLTSTSSTFTANSAIFGKVYFPRLVLPLSTVISNIVKLGIQLCVLAFGMIWYYFHPDPKYVNITLSYRILFIPLLMVIMAGIGLGLGIIISSITTKYRDFVVLLTFAVQLGMYATPIVFPLSYFDAHSHHRLIIRLNPLTSIVEAFRYTLFGVGSVNMNLILYSVGFMVVVIVIGSVIFNRVEKSFMDTV